ncbi:hypothetical protein SKAU_G00288460 [Synaphobranchus kaupii]|uniref:Uncharacterized protein n=1 Tax=Synaphobranchus kaupii TaxID=118154 RepID=A0A9Q1IM23_SYNKA|nr:hypothetical protein SKAU_G00288460 [Synaphobranchus kaupii]
MLRYAAAASKNMANNKVNSINPDPEAVTENTQGTLKTCLPMLRGFKAHLPIPSGCISFLARRGQRRASPPHAPLSDPRKKTSREEQRPERKLTAPAHIKYNCPA